MQQAQAVTRRAVKFIRDWLEKSGGFQLYAFILFVAMTAAYNAQIGRMGYYYDDWEGVFMQKQLFSSQQIWQYFLIDRPFSSILHSLYNPVFGLSPIGWRIFGQLINWAAILVLVRTLLLIWPKRIMEIGWIGLLLALYPGINRQFVIRTSMPHYTSMLLFALSLWFMVKAEIGTRRRTVFMLVSIGLGILQVLFIEYFTGLELIRAFLIFYLVRRDNRSTMQSFRKAFIRWLPYASVFALFLFYRIAIHPAIQADGMVVKYSPKILAQVLANPISMGIHYAEIVLQDVVYSVVYIWSGIFAPGEIDLAARATLVSWLLGAVVAILCAAAIAVWHRKAVAAEEKESFPVLVGFICLAALLLGGLPIWSIGQQATVGIWSGRFLFGPVMGAVPLVVLLIIWVTSQPRRQVQGILLAVLLAGSFSIQFRLANKYALNWEYQRDYYWQLKWRAPALKTGTFILAPDTPFSYNADYQIAFAINMLYNPGNNQTNLPYYWFDGPDDMIDFTTQKYPQAKEADVTFRSLRFQSDMQHALPVTYRPARSCLQVMDPVYQDEPGLLAVERQLFDIPGNHLIQDLDGSVPQDVFGQEPAHGWCYTYQKADLARENQRWEDVNQLWVEASSNGLKPQFGPEYLPFIEASIWTSSWDQAIQMTAQANETEDMPPFLCSSWSRIVKSAPDSAEKQASWDAVKKQYGCGNPQD